MSDLITFSSSGFPRPARVIGFRGFEAISRPYRFEVYVSIPSDDGGDVDFADLVGEKAALVIDRAGDGIPPFVLAGVLGGVDLVHEYGGSALLRATIVPRMTQLGLSRHSRIFTKKSAPDVIKAVLSDNGVTDHAFRLSRSYEVEEHISQYRESDLDFISRWMEREGIFYCFEHTDAGETVVFYDDKAYPVDGLGKPARYHPQRGEDRSAGASFRSFSSQNNAVPARISLRDYDYARPTLDMSGAAQVHARGAGEVNLYGERFFSPGAGQQLAKIRAEEMLARQSTFQATGTRLHTRAGHTFDLEEHPRARFNTQYLAVEVRHQGNQAAQDEELKQLIGLEHEDTYYVEVFAIPAATQFRPESRTAWPRIYGFENGTIDGPGDSEYAQIDEYGRYLVKFNFDESQSAAGSGSTYVRMMQPHGGSIEGFHFPLRKGVEVVLSFMGGDPDRPVISGVVPNVLTPSPVTSGNMTKNVIQTGGRNRFELEDLAGAQRVTLSTPSSNSYLRMGAPNDGHELIVKTDDNTLLDAGKTLDTRVGMNGGGDWNINVKNHVKSEVATGDVTTKVVAGSVTSTVNKDITTTAETGDIATTATAGDISITATAGDITTTAKAGEIEMTAEKDGKFVSNNGTITIDAKNGNMVIHALGKITMTAEEKEIVVSGPSDEWIKEDETVKREANSYTETRGSVFSKTVGETVGLSLGEVREVKAGGVVEVKAGAILECMFGSKTAIALPLNVEIGLGVKLSMFYGLTGSISGGASLVVKSGVEVEMKSATFRSGAVDIQTLPIGLRQMGLLFQRSGFTVIT